MIERNSSLTKRQILSIPAVGVLVTACELGLEFIEDNPEKYTVKLKPNETAAARIDSLDKQIFQHLALVDFGDWQEEMALIDIGHQSVRSIGYLWIVTGKDFELVPTSSSLKALVVSMEGSELSVRQVKSFRAAELVRKPPLPAAYQDRELIRFYLRSPDSKADIRSIAETGLKVFLQEVDLVTSRIYTEKGFIISKGNR